MDKPLRALLIEDSEDDALLLLHQLKRGGYEPIYERVDTPEQMERALKEADERGEPWEIILSDYYMPRFSGADALTLLKRLGYEEVPFIVVSGKVGEETAVEMMRAGAQDYITKENMVRLNSAIERELREARVRRERLQVREALDRSEERFRRLVEQAGEGIFLFDAETKHVLETNPAFQRMFGYASEELARMKLYDLVPHDPEGVDRNVRRALEQRNLLVGERSYRRKDGSVIDVEVSGSVISYGDKEVVCSIVRDITERKRAESTLQEIREAERTRMARDLHDGVLQNLTYASLEAQVVQTISEKQEASKRLERIVEALQRAGRELRGAVYNLRSGEEQDRPLPRLLESLVEQSRKMTPGCEIRLEIEEDFPAASLGEKGAEILRVVQEALTNARRHSGAEHILVALRMEGDKLVTEVSDDGRGFGPDTAMGAGLKSMKERAATLDADLEVKTEPGRGTRVRLCVPS